MQPALQSLPEEIRDTLARILAYMGGLAILAMLAASLFQTPAMVAAIGPWPPRPQWIEIERPYPAFELVLPELGEPSRYAILRRNTDGARKDVLTWGDAAGSGSYVTIEVYRPGSAGERFIDATSEVAARIVDFTVTDDVKPAGTIDGKFGAVPLVDFAIAPAGKERRCLGFARPFDQPLMQIAGWYCSAGEEVVNRATLACALDRLTVRSAGSDAQLAESFAGAELKRSFCGQRNPILAATSDRRDRIAASQPPKLRGRIRLQ